MILNKNFNEILFIYLFANKYKKLAFFRERRGGVFSDICKDTYQFG